MEGVGPFIKTKHNRDCLYITKNGVGILHDSCWEKFFAQKRALYTSALKKETLLAKENYVNNIYARLIKWWQVKKSFCTTKQLAKVANCSVVQF